VLSPIEVNLLVGDRVAFHLYDKGKEVSGGSWGVIPGRILGSWFGHGIFTVEAKSPGTARVGVQIGSSRYANVIVTVYPGLKLPKGVERTVEFTPAGRPLTAEIDAGPGTATPATNCPKACRI
jgi:hypothetical protein